MRCAACRRKLGVVAIACRCGKTYCAKHRIRHSCTHDYKAEHKHVLAAANPTVSFTKVKKI